jgi:hypothetical protein
MSRWHDLLPLSQFLFETRASGALFKVALVASLAAGGIWYCVERNRRFPLKQLIASIAVTTISAAIVAGFLAAIHVMLSQSGH